MGHHDKAKEYLDHTLKTSTGSREVPAWDTVGAQLTTAGWPVSPLQGPGAGGDHTQGHTGAPPTLSQGEAEATRPQILISRWVFCGPHYIF